MGGEVIGFFVGVLVGGSLGYIAAAITCGYREREDAHLSTMLLRVMVEKDPDIWPYRVEKWIDDDGTVVRSFLDAEGRVHHVDKGTLG